MIGLKGRMNVSSWLRDEKLTEIQVIDNSGAVIAECINVLKVKTRQHADGKATVGECTYAWLPECSRAFESEYMGLKRRCPSEGSVKLVRGYLGPAPGGLNVERSKEGYLVHDAAFTHEGLGLESMSAVGAFGKLCRGQL